MVKLLSVAATRCCQGHSDDAGATMIWKYLKKDDATELIEWTLAKLDREPIIENGQMFWPWMSRAEREWEIHGEPSSDNKRGRPRDDNVWEAARDVGLIRQLWKDHKEFLDHKFKRSKNGNITVIAERIAADRWHVDVEAVYNRIKKLKRPDR
jgi:hypothetical protein